VKLALVEPTYLSTDIANNKWMEEIPPEQRKVNKELAYKQWFNLYSILTQGATVYLIPPKKEFQDQVYATNAG
jgi:N-dimethylarginine dimethylaminohydrolase